MMQPTQWTRLAWTEPFWIAVLAPSLLLPGRFWTVTYQPFLVLLLLLFWPIRRLAYGRFSVRTPLDWSIGLLVLWLTVSLLASVDMIRSWESVGYIALGIALYYALVNWPATRDHPQLVTWMLVMLGIGLSLLGLMVVSTSKPIAQQAGLAHGRLVAGNLLGETLNPNVWAGALAFMIPLYAGLAVTPNWSRHRWPRAVLASLALITIGLLLTTASRGAYLALAASLATLLVLRWPRSIYLVATLLVGGLGLIAWLGPQSAAEVLLADAELGGWAGRPEIWRRAISAIQDFPWGGVGLGLFDQAIPMLYPYFVMADDVEHAHNLFLQIGVDMGLPGLIAYLATVIGVFAMVARPLRRPAHDGCANDDVDRAMLRKRWLQWALAAGAASALVAMLVHGLMDAVLWGTKLTFLPWILFALAANLRHGEQVKRVLSESMWSDPET